MKTIKQLEKEIEERKRNINRMKELEKNGVPPDSKEWFDLRDNKTEHIGFGYDKLILENEAQLFQTKAIKKMIEECSFNADKMPVQVEGSKILVTEEILSKIEGEK